MNGDPKKWKKLPWRCPHCHEKSTPVSCAICTREMCEDCISFHTVGKICGLCFDREINEQLSNKGN